MESNSILRRRFSYSFVNLTVAFLIINVGLYLLDRYIMSGRIFGSFALNSQTVFARGQIWQIFTYMFLHANFNHLFFNMIVLVMFGFTLERRMGSKEFALYYLLTGTLTGFVSALIMLKSGGMMVGASGALYALLLAYATYFPDNRMLLFYFLPLRAPTAVLVITALAILMQIFGVFGNIAHYAHLAGIFFGFIYFIIRLGVNPLLVFRRRE